MEIGVISDTHGLVRPEVYEAFEGVELILHAGDIGDPGVIIELEAIAPVKAVAGNMDAGQNMGFPESASFQLQGKAIRLQHIFYEVSAPEKSPRGPVRDIVIFGHSHKPANIRAGDTLYFNPGSAGPRRFVLPICVGRLTLENGNVEGRIIHLDKTSDTGK